ncbi:MAG: MFS transporter [Pseudomonadota bacterium]
MLSRIVPNRWVVLAAFAGVAGVSQMLWLNFAPLISLLQEKYGVSELAASLPTLVFPLLYVVLSLHAGSMVDHRGFKFTVALGAILMAVFSVVRIHEAYWAVLVGQVGIAIGQPYVLNGISKLVGDWFGEEETALATGLGTVGLFLGCALGLALTPALVSVDYQFAMLVFSGIAIAAAVFFILFARENPDKPRHIIEQSGWHEIKTLLANKYLIIVLVLSFLGLGFFNGLTTWLEPILAVGGISAEQAGLIGGMFIIGGIGGAIVIPGLSDHFQRRKPFLVVCVLLGLILVGPLCHTNSVGYGLLLSGVLGFFFLPAYALLLAISEELAGREHAGMATGMLMLVGNAGGVAVILAMDWVKGPVGHWDYAINLMAALLAVALALCFVLRETFIDQEQ